MAPPHDDDGSWPLLATCFQAHMHNIRNDPVRAHWDAAFVSTFIGGTLAVARGAVAAILQPRGLRLSTFSAVTQSCLPLYIIPFALGAQWDTYAATSTTSDETASTYSSDADVLG